MDFCNNKVSLVDSLEEFDSRYIESCNLAISGIRTRSKSLGCLASHLDASEEQDSSSNNLQAGCEYESELPSLSSPLLDDPSISTCTFADEGQESRNSFATVPKTIHIFEEFSNTNSSLASSHTKPSNITKIYDIGSFGKSLCYYSRSRHSFPNMKNMDKPLVKKIKKIPTTFKTNYGVKLNRKNSNKSNILSCNMISPLHNPGTNQ